MITREHIINEIKRTAIANGGVPLGAKRFEIETGIKPYNWGQFWPRWTEAQCESGFAPNEFQTAFSDELLMQSLIQLIRELKKFPVPSELRMKSRNDSNFPNDKVFDRLGNKQQRLRKIIAYCQSRVGYDDIIHVCSQLLTDIVPQQEISSADGPRVGYVYLLKFRRNDYKIGASNDPERRFGEIATKMPEASVQIHTVKTDDPFGVEAYWHRRFASKQLDKNSEWFQLSAADIQAFRRWKRIY
jgi:hypothetical protein